MNRGRLFLLIVAVLFIAFWWFGLPSVLGEHVKNRGSKNEKNVSSPHKNLH
jgi:hypothetical protein